MNNDKEYRLQALLIMATTKDLEKLKMLIEVELVFRDELSLKNGQKTT